MTIEMSNDNEILPTCKLTMLAPSFGMDLFVIAPHLNQNRPPGVSILTQSPGSIPASFRGYLTRGPR